MSKLRSQSRVTVRTPIQTRSGTFDDGRSWLVREVEVLDDDANKVMLRVLEGIETQVGVGIVQLETDWTSKGGKVTIVGFVPEPAAALAGKS